MRSARPSSSGSRPLSERSARQAQANQDASSIFERFGVDPQTWLTNLSNEGDEDVEGTETIHIHGDADVEQIFSDFARIVRAGARGCRRRRSTRLSSTR